LQESSPRRNALEILAPRNIRGAFSFLKQRRGCSSDAVPYHVYMNVIDQHEAFCQVLFLFIDAITFTGTEKSAETRLCAAVCRFSGWVV
jgi:hypothetical protein